MGKQEKLKQLRKEQKALKKEKKKKIIKGTVIYSLIILVAFLTALGGYFAYQKLTFKFKSYKTGERQYSQYPEMQIDKNKNYSAILDTNFGKIKIKLFAKDAPKTVNNFVVLSRDSFYNGLTFHRVVKDFMIQGGDPKGNGTGGPGYKFEDEKPPQKEYKRGTVAMANSGPDTNGSQFFIMQNDNPGLPPNYTIFGEVVEGIETVDKIAEQEVVENANGEKSTPKNKIEIKKITIEEK